MVEEKKVLFIQDWLRHYRVPLIKELASRCDLTLIQPNKSMKYEIDPARNVFLKYRRFKSFIWISGLYKIFKSDPYDKYILPFDVNWINCFLFSLLLPKDKVFWFGIGLSKRDVVNRIKVFFAKRNNLILYSDRSVEFFLNCEVPLKNINISPNTVHVPLPVLPHEKSFKTFLFVGSLDERKKLKSLLVVYNKLCEKLLEETPPLIIIGNGRCMDQLVQFSQSLHLTSKVEFLGEITQQDELRRYFMNAICCLSYGQAGLSVLQSIAHSTPFITCIDAVSGGEIDNISNGYTGYKLEDDRDVWVDKLLELTLDVELQIGLAANCSEFYHKERTISKMANGFKL